MSRRQLLALGLTEGQVEGMLARGELRRAFTGAFFVGPVDVRFGLEVAGVLACGPRAAASHLSAAYLLGLLPYPARPGNVHVTAPGARRRHAGISAHQGRLLPHEIRERHGIPVTSPVRTLLDLAAVATADELEAAVAEAFALGRANRNALLRAVRPGARGSARLRALLDAGPRRTRSKPERTLVAAIRAAGLPEPLTNHRLGRWEVDLYWPDAALVVEVDGYAAHSSPWAFERDRRKAADLEERGIAVRRVSARQVRAEVERTVRRIAGALAARRPPSPRGG